MIILKGEDNHPSPPEKGTWIPTFLKGNHLPTKVRFDGILEIFKDNPKRLP